MTADQRWLQHATRALAYRFEKATGNTGENFGDFRIGTHTRTPAAITNHLSDLALKAKALVRGEPCLEQEPPPLCFLEEKARFLRCLNELQVVLCAAVIELEDGKKLLQGPVLDMATHIGQLALLRGLYGEPVPKEDYYNAPID